MLVQRTYLTILMLSVLQIATGQSFNHWGRSFNEESSLLSGAVVGGGAGPSAIYYNPAIISDISESKLSFHASLFSFKFYDIKNGLGDGINLKWSTVQIEPRFASFMIKPRNHPEWSLEIAVLNNENFNIDIVHAIDKKENVLGGFSGEERYFALFKNQRRFRDDWIGLGWSWNLDPRFYIGVSMFVTIKTMEYNYSLDIEAYPVDTLAVAGNAGNFYSANYSESEYLKYNDYRLLWKLGVYYKEGRFSAGLCLTTPSVGGIYSDGKRVSRHQKQSNISDPETGLPLDNYLITDYRSKKEVAVNHKTPWSLAGGITWRSEDMENSLYTTAEYFGGLEAYRLVQADEGSNIASGTIPGNVMLNEWLTFVSGARPVLNVAIGYSMKVGKDLQLMTGFRTDFNYLKNLDSSPYVEDMLINSLKADQYHFTGGLSWRFLGQDFITGIQYTIGGEQGQKQMINLSDPVEYNPTEQAPLQGTRSNNMSSLTNSISLYLGATFNFGAGK